MVVCVAVVGAFGAEEASADGFVGVGAAHASSGAATPGLPAHVAGDLLVAVATAFEWHHAVDVAGGLE
jgi:hypothetical protein